MAANFAFYPQSISTYFTVGSTTITFTSTLQRSAGTSTLSVAAGLYQVQGCRVSNEGTNHAYINVTAAGNDPVLVQSPPNGILILAGTVETFRMQGLSVLQMTCKSGTTTTLGFTFGEGL